MIQLVERDNRLRQHIGGLDVRLAEVFFGVRSIFFHAALSQRESSLEGGA